MITEYTIQSIIEQLEDLQKVLKNARPVNGFPDSVGDPSYPFAIGYTTAGINNAIYSLGQLLN